MGAYQVTFITPFASTTYSIAYYTAGNLASGYNYPCLLYIKKDISSYITGGHPPEYVYYQNNNLCVCQGYDTNSYSIYSSVQGTTWT